MEVRKGRHLLILKNIIGADKVITSEDLALNAHSSIRTIKSDIAELNEQLKADGIGLCSQGNILGTFIFILLYGVTQSIAKYYFVYWGYEYGTSFIDEIFKSGLMQAMTKAASVLGLMMVGAMTAQMVSVPLNVTLNIGSTSVVLQDVIESIFPGLLGVLLLFYLVKLIKKGVRPSQLVIGILVLGLVGALIHIF